MVKGLLVFLVGVYCTVALPTPLLDHLSSGALRALSFPPVRNFIKSLNHEQKAFIFDVMTRDITVRKMLAATKAEQPEVYQKALDEIADSLHIEGKVTDADQILEKAKERIPAEAKGFADEAYEIVMNIVLNKDHDHNRAEIRKAARALDAKYNALDKSVQKKLDDAYPKLYELSRSKSFQDLLTDN